MSSRPRESLDSLTGLRFLAALHVVLFHRAVMLLDGAPSPLRAFVARGDIAVGLFFVLSGFILAFVYLARGVPAAIDAPTFWRARFARIYPVYAVGLLLSAPFLLWQARNGAGADDPVAFLLRIVPLGATLLQAWVPSAACAWNCPGWSLSTEAFFYLLFPLVAVPLARLTTRGLLASAAALWVIGVLPPLVAVWTGADAREPLVRALGHLPPLRLAEFLIGVCVGLLFVRHRDRVSRLGARMPLAATSVAALIAVVLAFGTAVPHVLLNVGLLAPLFACLIVTLATGRDPLARFLSSRPLVLLGEASYALYILHIPFGQWFDRVARGLGWDAWRSPLVFAAYLLSTVAASIVVYRWIELPARDVLRARLSRRSATAGPPAASHRLAAPASARAGDSRLPASSSS